MYNQQITLPRPGEYENLWRADGLYDVVIVIGYNDAPVVPGKGSAIFLHVARPGLSPTDGCVAVPLPVIVAISRLCDETTYIEIKV
jgi:L,D-peptidoglycan transpeptidase YkuD (ErfK/YbiS/YcfS/YnhG family)